MANGSHRAKLCEGALAWNVWREKNPSVVPDLDEVVLAPSQRQFGFENWGPINLKQARLRKCDLRYACLTAADLEAATLAEARLTNARLDRANLARADLGQAVFDGADLAEARLDAANVKGARLSAALNLTQAQVNQCQGDRATTLPPGLVMPLGWLRDDTPLVARVSGLGQAGAGGAKDPTAAAAEEVMKTLARAKAALRLPEERKEDKGPAPRGRHQPVSRKTRALTLAAAPRGRNRTLAVYLGGAVAVAIVLAVLFWSQLTIPAPVHSDDNAAPAKGAGSAILPPPGAVMRERPPPAEAAALAHPGEAEPVTQAPPALADIPPRNGKTVVEEPRSAAVNRTPPRLVETENEAPEAEPADPSGAKAVKARDVGFRAPAKASSSRPRAPRETPARRDKVSEPLPHPFAAQPCKPSRECLAGLEFCEC